MPRALSPQVATIRRVLTEALEGSDYVRAGQQWLYAETTVAACETDASGQRRLVVHLYALADLATHAEAHSGRERLFEAVRQADPQAASKLQLVVWPRPSAALQSSFAADLERCEQFFIEAAADARRSTPLLADAQFRLGAARLDVGWQHGPRIEVVLTVERPSAELIGAEAAATALRRLTRQHPELARRIRVDCVPQ